MKTLLICLEDHEYKRLAEIKKKKGLTWKQLLMSLCDDESEDGKNE
jgi:predicted DNA-binding ribbon-helix-helix protein